MYQRFLIFSLAFLIFSCSAENPAQNFPDGQFFTVQVTNEQFVIFVTDQETIRLASENFEGKNTLFPTGRLMRGNGGFNQPWSWHLLPDTVRMAGVAIEVCDGRPSHVEDHIDDYINAGGYCPWSAKIIKVGR